MPNGPWFPHPDTFLAPDFRGLPAGVWEIGNTASDHFPGRPRGAQLSGSHHLVPVPLGGFGAAVGGAAWYNGPANNKQSEPYAALNRLSPV
jgi:hypothetical protein